ncbi:MAG: helix-turn-helix domain-containing protein [Actinobacteria bacterium]|nr:helix-turn-helix domain-containing protein [Actinomycetota bacterium]
MTSNEVLRAAILGAGLSHETLAERVGVDQKTVERWVAGGRIPHRRTRLTVAQALGKDDVVLWPQTADEPQALRAAQAELVQLFPNRGSVPAQCWYELAGSAVETIDLLAYAASFLHDALPGFTDLLAERARTGTRVRLLFGDPTSEAVALRGEEEGIGDLLAGRCSLSWNYFRELLKEPGVEARQHGTTLYNSIFRFDDDILVNTHAYGVPASHSPVLHIRRLPGGRLFSHYVACIEDVWTEGQGRSRPHHAARPEGM